MVESNHFERDNVGMTYYIVEIADTVEPYGIQYLEQFVYCHTMRQMLAIGDMKPQLYMTPHTAQEAARDVIKCRQGDEIEVSVRRCEVSHE